MFKQYSCDDAYEIFSDRKEKLKSFQNESLTETDTRCKIIDSLFKEVLGWKEENIKREEHYRDNGASKYIDYIFTSNKNKFLVEAKNSDKYFNLPNSTKKAKKKGVLLQDENVKDALEQAIDYCNGHNIDVGCISNGLQIIVFISTNTKNEYDAYIFTDSQDIEEDFINFFSIFNPYCNALKTLNNKILSNSSNQIREAPQYSKSILDEIYNSDEKISRNPIDDYIKPIINEFLSDLISDGRDKYLEECYCTDERQVQYEKQLTALIRDEAPNIEIPTQDIESFNQSFKNSQEEMHSFRKKSDVMIIVGGVGAGKTTFIHRYFKNVLPDKIRKNIIWINVDFLRQSDEDINVMNYIYKESLNQIRDNYQFLEIDKWETLKQIYNYKITRLKKGALKPIYEADEEDFNKKIAEEIYKKTKNEVQFGQDVLKYLSLKQEKKKTICLSIDNADQMDENFQKRCIKAAFEFANKINSIVLLSMREESYWKLRKIKPFDAYQNFAYHISAPSVATVLAKRLEVARKYYGDKTMELVGNNDFKYEIEIDKFLKMISDSLYERNKFFNIDFFEALSANNVRFGQEMLSTFLVSGHTNTKEYIKTYLNSGDYLIPFHAIVRSIALGDYKYYHSHKSLLVNLFEFENDGFFSHFTKIRILKYLNKRKNMKSISGKGFINIEDMYTDFTEVCNKIENFRSSLTPLLNNHLIEADNGYRIDGSKVNFVRITSSGYYYLEVLLNEFSYLERLCEDTSITSKRYFDKLNEITNKIIHNHYSGKMNLRLDRMKVFLSYLAKEEDKEQKYIDNKQIKYNIMEPIIENFKRQSKEIKQAIN